MVLLEIWVGVSPPSLSSIGSEVMLIAQVLVIAVGLVYATRAGCVNVVLWRMRSAPVKTALSFEQFLEFEVSSLERHEFVDGNLFVMAGGTLKHNFLKDELHSLWRVAARAVGCRSFTGDVITRLPNDTGYFPDVFVTCEAVNGSARVMTKPCIIVEVLSSSTEIFDRGEKWQNYQTIPSLEQYVLLSQSEPLAEVYTRQADGAWRYQSFSGAAIISFPSISFELSLKTLYADLPVN